MSSSQTKSNGPRMLQPWLGGMILVVVVAVAAANLMRSAVPAVSADAKQSALPATAGPNAKFAVVKTDAEWRKLLTPEQYDVTRKQGTEPAYSGAYWHNHDKGVYYCVDCGQKLFTSDTKFDSGTGWPSFYKPASKDAVLIRRDTSYGMVRNEVICSRCGAHLGHVFDDGPPPTGLRYCMNSAALRFEKAPSPSK